MLWLEQLPGWIRVVFIVGGTLLTAFASKLPDQIQTAGAWLGVLLIVIGLYSVGLHYIKTRWRKESTAQFNATALIIVLSAVVLGAFFWLRHPTEIEKEVSSAASSGHRWTSLSDEEESSLRMELRSIPQPKLMRVLCSDTDGRDLADTFMRVFHDSEWPTDNPIYNAGASPVGISVNQRDTTDRKLADAIEKSTKGRLKVYMRADDLDSVTLIIGPKPAS
jgi:hypothetical protein